MLSRNHENFKLDIWAANSFRNLNVTRYDFHWKFLKSLAQNKVMNIFNKRYVPVHILNTKNLIYTVENEIYNKKNQCFIEQSLNFRYIISHCHI